ncbi:MAG: hypothetical protein HZB79_02950 [Deltaproteobacteria bacterium]|nr:hypothetical protein [Deltaproteobacteria bacterium]
MKIEGSNIVMTSTHVLVKKDEVKEELRFWVDDTEPLHPPEPAHKDRVTITDEAKSISAKKHNPQRGVNKIKKDIDPPIDPLAGDKIFVLKRMIESLTGRKIKVADLSELQKDGDTDIDYRELQSDIKPPQEDEPDREGWGLVYNRSESHYENEETSFSAKGIIKTKDGKEISFTLNLKMSREFASEENMNLRLGDAKKIDPLVINFDGNSAELTDMKFAFDLDADGNAENVSFVGSGSGFLALDINNDGKINDGRELFGPQTGDGFAELKQYDEDNNNWIDENDSIYNKLYIWTKDAQGIDSLSGLKEKGVEAIHLSSIGSSFDLTDSQNQLNGQINTTGVYLTSDDNVKTLQQIDLVA